MSISRKATLYIDQYGSRFSATTLKALKEQVPGHVSAMYVDRKDGRTVKIGYVIGQHWLRAYAPVEEKA